MSTGNNRAGSVPPLFMFGFERSGTTLLSMMVGAHPEIAVPLTVTGLWYVYAEKLERFGGLRHRDDLEHLVDALLEEERIRLWDVELDRTEVLDGLELGSFGAVVERFHRLYARKKNKPVWGNLDIATLDEMDVANRWFPNARFLHIVRDGRDVALSHQTMPYGAGNTLETAEKWVHRLQVNLKMGSILGEKRYQVVRYEDLILDTETTLKKICDFFGVDYSRQMLEYPGMVDEKVPDDRRWLWPALGGPPDRSKVDRWKTNMSGTRRIVFEGVAHDMLARLGYQVYDRVPKRVSAYAFEIACGVGRGGRVKRFLAKLGWNRPSLLERQGKGKVRGGYKEVQTASFGDLVQKGVYDTDFEHSRGTQRFFGECLESSCARVSSDNGIAILDAGCGPGAWLDYVSQSLTRNGVELFGFDLTPEMVELAQRRLSGRVASDHIQTGDILEDQSFAFDQVDRRFEIIYAFDVLQQVPRAKQRAALQTILGRLAPGGCAVIFDHERHSMHGYKMGFRKFVTKYLGIGLVPLYYCNARYPALSAIASQLNATGKFSAEVKAAQESPKRALIVQVSRT